MSTDRRKKQTYQERSKVLISPHNRPRNQRAETMCIPYYRNENELTGTAIFRFLYTMNYNMFNNIVEINGKVSKPQFRKLTFLRIKIQQDQSSYIKLKKKISNKGETCSKFNDQHLRFNVWENYLATG
jgi:hypothetical protein